jgi:hypothetical protein
VNREMRNLGRGVRQLQWEANGGWAGLVVDLIIFAAKWAAIGALVHTGWKLVR